MKETLTACLNDALDGNNFEISYFIQKKEKNWK